MTQTLSQKYDALEEFDILEEDLPTEITNNLASNILLRPYQIKALQRWMHFKNKFQKANPHLLFHMATGSGKTVLMAALMLDLYKLNYRNFLFFVNSTQIIEKTKDNFLNPTSSKFLFAPQVRIENLPVDIRSVENFDAVSDKGINIHFTTIQGLHSRIQNPRENSVTLEDFKEHQIVLVSDEAHHLNTETKAKNKLSQSEQKIMESWERTVTNIFNQNPKNILLEFTATADMGHEKIREKYRDKILFDYPLKQFRDDGYSKDIELRQADLEPGDRMKQAIVLSQYRRKLAETYGIYCKPVVLMKSRTINESNDNEALFRDIIRNLDDNGLRNLRVSSQGDKTLSKAFSYILDERGMGEYELAIELKGEFAPEKTVNVNNLKDLETRQIELNTLEEWSNEIRVIFAVNKLNEGWDVLNLFDIVRLYNIRDGKDNKVGKTTMAEAQLIGRGARYFPFTIRDQLDLAPEKRKFDNNLDYPLRILEELYYHCSHNPRYISDIKNALRETGMLDENEKTVELKLKDNFMETSLYQNGIIWVNDRKPNPRDRIRGLKDYNVEKYFSYNLNTGEISEESAFVTGQGKLATSTEKPSTKEMQLNEFGRHILGFAMDSNIFFHYASLQKYFPILSGITEFIDTKEYLGYIVVKVNGLKSEILNLTASKKLKITQHILKKIENTVKFNAVDYVGTAEFNPRKISRYFTNKIIKLRTNGDAGLSWNESLLDGLDRIDIANEDWHVYEDCFGTDQEKYFVKFLYEQKERLNELYEDFYLLRNEKAVKLYSFDDGEGFEPDYVLLLRKKGDEEAIILQLFIEPKGEQLMDKDRWKEDFLNDIRNIAQQHPPGKGNRYTVCGLPFYNADGHDHTKFREKFDEYLTDFSTGEIQKS